MGRTGLAVVHLRLGRVVPEDPINHDNFFALGEPPLAADTTGSLRRRRGKPEGSENSDSEGDETP